MPASTVLMILDEVAPTGTTLPSQTDAAVRIARDVMQDADFWWKRLEPGSAPEAPWLKKVLVAIMEVFIGLTGKVFSLIARLLRFLFGLAPGETSGGAILVWLLAGLLIAWAVWKIIPLVWGRSGLKALPSRPDTSGSELPAAASDLREQAVSALGEGRYAEAIRLALLTLIAALEQQGLLRYSTTRTNHEYRSELRSYPDLAERFGRLAQIYEWVWYGRESADREQAEASIRLCELPIDGEGVARG